MTSYRCAKPTRSAATCTGFQDDLDFIKVQLARLSTQNEVWRAAMLGMLAGAVAAVTLVEPFSRPCLSLRWRAPSHFKTTRPQAGNGWSSVSV